MGCTHVRIRGQNLHIFLETHSTLNHICFIRTKNLVCSCFCVANEAEECPAVDECHRTGVCSGEILDSFDMPEPADHFDCIKLCLSNADCNTWNYNPTSGHLCSLHADCGNFNRTSCTDCFFGNKNCPHSKCCVSNALILPLVWLNWWKNDLHSSILELY